ncbi:MAG: helix-turn-helix domain-containing protein [Oscillospiraceae bacterium]|nr:helix-turn-helix domain-containing protein [Oscillospiraceae bacterium]
MENLIGERIKQRCKELNINTPYIHQETGMSTGVISAWKNGQKLPSAPSLIKLSEILNCSVDWLLFGDLPIERSSKREISQSSGSELLADFSRLDPDDQEEVREIIRLKLRKKTRGGVGSSASGDPDRVKDAEDMGVVSA